MIDTEAIAQKVPVFVFFSCLLCFLFFFFACLLAVGAWLRASRSAASSFSRRLVWSPARRRPEPSLPPSSPLFGGLL